MSDLIGALSGMWEGFKDAVAPRSEEEEENERKRAAAQQGPGMDMYERMRSMEGGGSVPSSSMYGEQGPVGMTPSTSSASGIAVPPSAASYAGGYPPHGHHAPVSMGYGAHGSPHPVSAAPPSYEAFSSSGHGPVPMTTSAGPTSHHMSAPPTTVDAYSGPHHAHHHHMPQHSDAVGISVDNSGPSGQSWSHAPPYSTAPVSHGWSAPPAAAGSYSSGGAPAPSHSHAHAHAPPPQHHPGSYSSGGAPAPAPSHVHAPPPQHHPAPSYHPVPPPEHSWSSPPPQYSSSVPSYSSGPAVSSPPPAYQQHPAGAAPGVPLFSPGAAGMRGTRRKKRTTAARAIPVVDDGFITTVGNKELAAQYGNHDPASLMQAAPGPPPVSAPVPPPQAYPTATHFQHHPPSDPSLHMVQSPTAKSEEGRWM